jgi:hypothetical protein
MTGDICFFAFYDLGYVSGELFTYLAESFQLFDHG